MSDESRAELARTMVTQLPRWGSWAVNIRDFVTPYGRLGFRQLAILWAIRHDLIPADELSPTNLAQQQGVRPSVITRALTKLEEGGFLERAMDKHDRRRINIILTEKGREVSVYVEQMYLREIMDSMRDLDDVQIDELTRAVGVLTDIIDDLETRGHEFGPIPDRAAP